jgi:hypothetical protein
LAGLKVTRLTGWQVGRFEGFNIPTFQRFNVPTFQPSNIPTFQPSNLLSFERSDVVFDAVLTDPTAVRVRLQIRHEAANLATAFLAQGCQFLKLVVRNVFYIQRNVRLRAQLAGRGFGMAQVLDKLGLGATFKPFGDVGHYRDGRPAHLVF